MATEAFSTKHRMFWSRIVVLLALTYIFLDAPPKILPKWELELGELSGLVMLAIAAFGRVWCLVFVAGRKNNALVTDGPYSIMRNPLYFFSFIGAVGFGLAVENPILALSLAIIFALYYPFVVRREERFLLAKFGAPFREYMAAVPRWFPKLGFYREPQTVMVYAAKIRSGILQAMWFIWAFLLWEAIELFHNIPILGQG